METKIFCCFGFAVILSLWQIGVLQTDCPMKPLDWLNCTKKRDARERFCFANLRPRLHRSGQILARIRAAFRFHSTGETAQVFGRQTELQSCTVPCKLIAQVENSSVQKFVPTRVNVVLTYCFFWRCGRCHDVLKSLIRQNSIQIIWF